MNKTHVVPLEGWEFRTNGDFFSAIHEPCQFGCYTHMSNIYQPSDSQEFLLDVINHVC